MMTTSARSPSGAGPGAPGENPGAVTRGDQRLLPKIAQHEQEEVDEVEVERQRAHDRGRVLVDVGHGAVLQALHVPGREAGEDDHAEDADDEAGHAAVGEEEELHEHDDDEADQAHEEDAAQARQVALRDGAVEGRAAEDGGRTREGRDDARDADGADVRQDDDAEDEAHRQRVDEEEAQRHERRDARDEEADREDEHELADEERQPELDDALLEGGVAHDEGGAGGGEQHADEHPHEAAGQEALARHAGDDGAALERRSGRRSRSRSPDLRPGPGSAGHPCWTARSFDPFCGRPTVGAMHPESTASSKRRLPLEWPGSSLGASGAAPDAGAHASDELSRVGATAPRGALRLLGQARQHPEHVGEPVQVGHQPGAWHEALVVERDDAPLGASNATVRLTSRAAERRLAPGTMNSRGISTADSASREDVLERAEHRLVDARLAVAQPVPGLGVGGQLRAGHEQLALQLRSVAPRPARGLRQPPGNARRSDLGARDAEAGDGLVDAAVGLGARVVLGDATAVEQPGGAVIALAGGDDAAGDAALPAARLAAPARSCSSASGTAASPGQAGVAGIPALGQQRDAHSWPSASSAASLTCWIIEPA